MKLYLIDAHCHINSEELYNDADGIVERAGAAGVKRMLLASSDLVSSLQAAELAHRYSARGVFAAVGVHPHEAARFADGLPPELLALTDDPRVVAVGESGLDYYYDLSPREVQKKVMWMHIQWALTAQKPLVLHVRDAMEDALALLDDFAAQNGKLPPLMFHCYVGGLEFLDDMRRLDAYMSLGGPVTWAKNDALRAVAAQVPPERLLCETDSPWLTPKPYRGKLNEPAYVTFVYDELAKVLLMDPEVLARTVDANAARLFGWGRLYV